MLSSRNLAPLFHVCTEIANEIVDDDGFVSVRNLLARFHTKLRLRPLLVEGMIGSIQSQSSHLPEWTVLIDSERYPDVQSSIAQESLATPLPTAFRFTVAHELAHTLAFRSSEFGVALDGAFEETQNRAALVKAIEAETDRLAPLLLCSERTLASQLRRITGPIDLSHVTKLLHQSGMSREVFLNRLALSRALDKDGLWQRPHLREFGLGIGVWNESCRATFRRWPLFLNFTRLTPKGFLTIQDQDRVPFDIAFGPESVAAIRDRSEVCVDSSAGTLASPNAGQLTLEISAENVNRVAGASFFTLVRSRHIRNEIEAFEHIRRSRSAREAP